MTVVAYLDCFSGISGDMLLGALLDAGASLERLRAGLDTLPLGGYQLIAAPTVAHGLRGTAANVARIIPEENSVVIASTPRTPRTSWPSASPVKPAFVGSKAARSAAGIVAQCWWLSTSTDRPIMAAAKTSTIHDVERTLRSFSHSILAVERKL